MFNRLCDVNSNFDISTISAFTDKILSFPFGEVAVFHGKTEPEKSILIAAHTDKSGLICTEICSDGTVAATQIGNHIPHSDAFSFAVSEKGIVAAVICTETDGKVSYKLDLGAKDKTEAEKSVSVGDVFRPENTVRRLSDTVATGAGISVTAPILTLTALCEALSKDAPRCTVYVAFLNEGQFAFGQYSAAALKISPSLAVCVGAISASPATKLTIGCGSIVRLADKSFGSDKPLSDSLINAGAVPVVLTEGSCAAAKVQGVGVPSSQLDIPVKHLSTHTEMIDLADIAAASDILKKFCR